MRRSGAAGKVPSLKAMRSTMVTHLHEEGVPLEVIAKVTGHLGIAVTRDHYLFVAAERTRTQYAALAERLTSGRSDHRTDHWITATANRERGDLVK
jgi:intergrase/recombinase